MSEFRRRLLYAKPKEIPNYLCFTALEDIVFTFTIAQQIDATDCEYIEYSLDEGVSWVRTNNVTNQAVTITTPTILDGNKVLWRGIGYKYSNGYYHSIFSSSGNYKVGGNIASLIYGKNFTNATEYRRRYATNHSDNRSIFQNLFYNCTTLLDASELILPNIGFNYNTASFYGMFRGCTNLVDASFELPTIISERNADNQGQYQQMFFGCSSLVNPPIFKMEGVNNNQFAGMFYQCVSLIDAPNLKTIISVSKNCCYEMFSGCTSLSNILSIPCATTLAEMCYYAMFKGCKSLIKAPELPATTLSSGCYNEMFRNCISLETIEVEELPAAVLTSTCYRYMFAGCSKLTAAFKINATTINSQSCLSMFDRCSNLNYVFCMIIDLNPSNGLQGWMYGVPNVSTSIFVKHIDATWTTTGNGGVPTNWTIIYYDPALGKYYRDQQRSQECDDHGNPI